MSARQQARLDARAYRKLMDDAWANPAPRFDPHGNQLWNEAELAARHLASLTPERRAELEKPL